jgi:hypothetical protein
MGLGVARAAPLREENRKLKQVVADLTLDARSPHPAGDRPNEDPKPRARCTLAEWGQTIYRLSQRRAARLIPVRRNTWGYRLTRDPQEALRQRLSELAGVRVRFGYRRLTVLLRREGRRVNAKRTYRLYGLEGTRPTAIDRRVVRFGDPLRRLALPSRWLLQCPLYGN